MKRFGLLVIFDEIVIILGLFIYSQNRSITLIQHVMTRIQQAVDFHSIFHQCLNLSIYCFDQSVKKDYFATLIDCSLFVGSDAAT
jgi:hypothetical protein